MPADRPVPASFVLDHTAPDRPSLVPEVTLRVATDVVALWEAIERATERRDFRASPGPFCSWCGHQALCPAHGGTPPPFPEPRQEAAPNGLADPADPPVPGPAAED